MVASTAIPVSRSRSSRREAFSGAVLVAGAAALFAGTLFYARLTPELGLPALPGERTGALADALAVGAQSLSLAGGWAFAGDVLLLAACLALVRRRRGSDLDSVGWALMGASAAIAMIFDSMTAALFWPLAHAADPAPFLAVKAWFDLLFAAGNIPFGLGFMAVLWADLSSESPLLSRWFGAFGILVGAAAAVSGFGYLTGLAHLPLAIGLTVTFGCIVLAALGVQIARGDGAAVAA